MAKLGMLEIHVASFKSQFESGDFVDDDELAVVKERVTDSKRRLDIENDYYCTSPA